MTPAGRPADLPTYLPTAIAININTTTLGSGRATVLQGAVHLVLLAKFLFLAVVPWRRWPFVSRGQPAGGSKRP